MALPPIFVKSDGHGRLRLSREVAERLPWLKEPGKVDAWIYILDTGRFRLFPRSEVEDNVTFRRIASKMERAEELQPETDAFDAEDSEMAAMAALLLPVKLTYTNGVGWRLQIPANSYLASASAEGGFYAIFSQGYLEFWKQESLEKALQKARSDLTAQ